MDVFSITPEGEGPAELTDDDVVKPLGRCECWDVNCPGSHYEEQCSQKATTTLVRVDWNGETVQFCDTCAEDALNSGLFA